MPLIEAWWLDKMASETSKNIKNCSQQKHWEHFLHIPFDSLDMQELISSALKSKLE